MVVFHLDEVNDSAADKDLLLRIPTIPKQATHGNDGNSTSDLTKRADDTAASCPMPSSRRNIYRPLPSTMCSLWADYAPWVPTGRLSSRTTRCRKLGMCLLQNGMWTLLRDRFHVKSNSMCP
jgi:hypothetical protein